MWIKKHILLIIFTSVFVILQHNVTNAKRILVVGHIPSYSHHLSYRGILLELNRRGHEIVSITTNPMKNASLTNYTEIDINYFYDGIYLYKDLPYQTLTELCMNLPFLEAERYLWKGITILSQELFKNSEVKKLYAANSNEHFDAVIIAQSSSLALNILAHRFNAPLIGMSSLDIFNHIRFILGSPVLPSHLSNWQTNLEITKNMPFWQRFSNFYSVWKQIYKYMTVQLSIENAIVKETFGNDSPDVYDITKNISLFLVNKHPVISIARPEQPNVVFYHGAHITDAPPPLPKDLKQFLDNANEGFIYVSLGTNVKWKDMPDNLFKIFLDALSSLPYKVLWKYDPKFLPKKYNNILALEWLPQQSVLAHPNIKLLFYQGGIQSSEEAIHYGVPMIGIPIIWDQKHQVQKMVNLGICIRLDVKKLSKEIITTAIHDILNDKRYKERVVELSKLYNDKQHDVIQNAVWRIEHIMRHRRARDILRDSICEEPWYQQYNWDIVGFLAVAIFIIFLVSLYVLLQTLRFICGLYRNHYCGAQCNSIKSKNE